MKPIILLAIFCLALAACDKKPTDPFKQTPDEIKADIEGSHPAAYYVLAQKLFATDKKDEGVFWFYVGQLRYRYHLIANPKLEPSGDPALFGALNADVGAPINRYAFGDIPKLAKTLDEVLAWDDSHDNTYTPKTRAPAEYKKIRDGLEQLKGKILAEQETIKKSREANGIK